MTERDNYSIGQLVKRTKAGRKMIGMTTEKEREGAQWGGGKKGSE